LIDFQSDFILKENFSCVKLNNFYTSINDAFPNLQRMAQNMMASSVSSYVGKQTPTVMNITKAHRRSKSDDEHLRCVQRIVATNQLQVLMHWVKRKIDNSILTKFEGNCLYDVLKYMYL